MSKKPTAAMKRNLDRLVENITTGDLCKNSLLTKFDA